MGLLPACLCGLQRRGQQLGMRPRGKLREEHLSHGYTDQSLGNFRPNPWYRRLGKLEGDPSLACDGAALISILLEYQSLDVGPYGPYDWVGF